MAGRPDYSNFTEYGIEDTAERVAWVSWLILILMISLVGNIMILVASTRPGSLKLNPVIVCLMRHLAACDLLITLTGILPQITPLLVNRNIMDVKLSYPLVYLANYSFCVSPLLICTMTVTKLVLVKLPSRSAPWTRSHGNGLCLVIWLTSLLFPALYLIINPTDITFDYRLYNYNFSYSSHVWGWLTPAMFTFSSFIPNLVMMITSCLLVSHLNNAREVALRSGAKARWQGIVTVVLSALSYFISRLPYSVYHVTRRNVPQDNAGFHTYFYRAGATFSYFSEVDKFLIYWFTVKSFRVSLKMHVQRTPRRAARCGSEDVRRGSQRSGVIQRDYQPTPAQQGAVDLSD